MSMTDKQVIAETISPDTTGWPWKYDEPVGYWKNGKWTERLIPNLGPHNLLRLIEWAAGQGWWWTILDGADDRYPGYSPGERVGGVLKRFIDDARELPQVVEDILCIIAHAIRREKDRASIQPTR